MLRRDTMSGKERTGRLQIIMKKSDRANRRKLFHEVIFQIGNREDMAVGTLEGNQAVKVLDEYVKDFQKRNPTLRVFSCYLHQDEATPHLLIDFVPYVDQLEGKRNGYQSFTETGIEKSWISRWK